MQEAVAYVFARMFVCDLEDPAIGHMALEFLWKSHAMKRAADDRLGLGPLRYCDRG